MSATHPFVLSAVAAEIEAHVAATGWDRPPALFALVTAEQVAAGDPETAARLGIEPGAALAPIEQEALPDGPLDEALAGIGWPAEVAGCALSQEVLILPPGAEAALTADAGPEAAAAHPDRREARLVAAVVRDGTSAVVLRLRGGPGSADDELLTGPDLAPNLVGALLETLRDE
jgi:hypothetical protein